MIAVVLVGVLLSYLIGSIPFGYLIGRVRLGKDIRTLGSGNIGATNVARVVGGRWGVAALALDCVKGAVPVITLPAALATVAGNGTEAEAAWSNHLPVLFGIAAVVGHMFPCWLGFRGGKGVATGLGVIAVLSWQATLAAAAVFAAVACATRFVSLASMLAAITFAAVELWLLSPGAFSGGRWSLAAFSLVVPVLIIARHHTNVVRLWKGDEPRFQLPGK